MRRQASNSPKSKRRGARGTVLVEAAVVMSMLLVPMLLGVIVVGFNVIRLLQVNQINRDAGHMFARGVDFSSTASGAGSRAILYQLAPSLTKSDSTGTAVTILSLVQYVGPTICSNCANLRHAVFKQQIVLGNSGLKHSVYGTVPSGSMTTDGSFTVVNPTTDTAVRADGILALLPMADGDIAYVSETYFSSTDLRITGFSSPAGVYASAIF